MTGYVRQDTTDNIAAGKTANASDIDAEFDAVEAAFNETTGHTHDGSSAEGGPISVVGPAQDVTVSATQVLPKTDNTLDLGSDALRFKDLHLLGDVILDNATTDTSLSVTGDRVRLWHKAVSGGPEDQMGLEIDTGSNLIALTVQRDSTGQITFVEDDTFTPDVRARIRVSSDTDLLTDDEIPTRARGDTRWSQLDADNTFTGTNTSDKLVVTANSVTSETDIQMAGQAILTAETNMNFGITGSGPVVYRFYDNIADAATGNAGGTLIAEIRSDDTAVNSYTLLNRTMGNALYAATSHTHTVSQITDFDPTDYLPLAGGTITGDIDIGGNGTLGDRSGSGGTYVHLSSDLLRLTNSGEQSAYVQGEDGVRTQINYVNGGAALERIRVDATGISFSADVTTTGLIDGRDIAADGATLDSLSGFNPADYLPLTGGELTGASDLTIGSVGHNNLSLLNFRGRSADDLVDVRFLTNAETNANSTTDTWTIRADPTSNIQLRKDGAAVSQFFAEGGYQAITGDITASAGNVIVTNTSYPGFNSVMNQNGNFVAGGSVVAYGEVQARPSSANIAGNMGFGFRLNTGELQHLLYHNRGGDSLLINKYDSDGTNVRVIAQFPDTIAEGGTLALPSTLATREHGDDRWLQSSAGVSGSFTTTDGKTITVVNGQITSIV